MTPFTGHRPPEVSPEALRRFARRIWRNRSQRLVLILVVIVFAVISGSAAIAPWLFSTEALNRAAVGQLQFSSGLFVMARGPARLFLTPRPHIMMKDVAFADINGALLIETPELNCTLNLGRLLAGRVQVTALTLLKPKAIVDGDKGPIIAPGAAMRASLTRTQTPEAQEADAARLGVVNIIDGALTFKRRSGDQFFEKITLSMDWPRVGQPALIAGGVDWRGERHEALVWIARPGLLLRNDQSFMTARLDGKNLNFEAQGFAALGDLPHFSGHLAGRAAAAREALQLFDIRPRIPGALRDAEFSAEAIMDGKEARLENLHVRIDGNVYEGAASLKSVSGKSEVSAELKSEFLSLEPVFADLPALLNSEGQWSHEPFDLPDLNAIDVNLHLETAHARLGRLSVDQGSMTVLAQDGVLDLGLTRAQGYGGSMTAHVRMSPHAENMVAIHGTARAEKIDAGAFLWDLLGQQRIGGMLDIDIGLDAQAADPQGLMSSLAGQTNLALANAAIEGVDFPRALKLLSSNPLASAHAARSGHSRLSLANATINVANGKGVIVAGDGKGDDYGLSLSGEINLAERSMSLKTTASEIHPSHSASDVPIPHIVFDLTGGWDDPDWRPDPQSFILRSGAAAKLLPQVENQSPPAP